MKKQTRLAEELHTIHEGLVDDVPMVSTLTVFVCYISFLITGFATQNLDAMFSNCVGALMTFPIGIAALLIVRIFDRIVCSRLEKKYGQSNLEDSNAKQDCDK